MKTGKMVLCVIGFIAVIAGVIMIVASNMVPWAGSTMGWTNMPLLLCGAGFIVLSIVSWVFGFTPEDHTVRRWEYLVGRNQEHLLHVPEGSPLARVYERRVKYFQAKLDAYQSAHTWVKCPVCAAWNKPATLQCEKCGKEMAKI
jgi:hypothetical protein